MIPMPRHCELAKQSRCTDWHLDCFVPRNDDTHAPSLRACATAFSREWSVAESRVVICTWIASFLAMTFFPVIASLRSNPDVLICTWIASFLAMTTTKILKIL